MFTPGNRKRSFDLYGKKKWDRNPVMSRVIRLPFDIGYQIDSLFTLDQGFLVILLDFSFIASPSDPSFSEIRFLYITLLSSALLV